MPIYYAPVLATLFMLLAGSPAHAQDNHDDDDNGHYHDHQELEPGVNQKAHVHGIAKPLVVLEGVQLDIELHSPAMNLLGFEHHANSSKQQAKVENVKDALANANNLFQFDSEKCQLIDHEVVFGGEDKEHAQHKTEGHSDIESHYRYRCEHSNKLRSLTTTIPAKFPGIESLQVQWIANGRQGAKTLDKNQRQIILQ